MIARSAIAAFVLLAACTAETRRLPHRSSDPSGPQVQFGGRRTFLVGLATGGPIAEVSSDGAIVGREAGGPGKAVWRTGSAVFSGARASGGARTMRAGESWKLSPEVPGGRLRFAGRSYRGLIVVTCAAGAKLTVLNELDVEDYLRGVLPRESVPSWPLEALKAQAVTSRTYLASHHMRHSREGFDVCPSTHCQMYIGCGREDSRTNRAVDETRDEIVVHGGVPTKGYFYASCGGTTESAQAVWRGADFPYLVVRACPWGSDAGWYKWTVVLTGSDILTALRGRQLATGSEIRSIAVASRTGSGRVRALNVFTDTGAYEVASNAFRLALTGDRLRSTLFRVQRDDDGRFVFTGRGWGHGVGLCQWGSRGLAELGVGYRDILDFYFPGTSIGKWATTSSNI